MTIRLDRARNLYLRGIGDGDISVVADYTGDVYIQHSGGVPDGVEGFTEFFEEFLQRHPEREIYVVRALEDENGVFLHAHQVLDGGDVQWVTMDWFRFDGDDKIVEHWDVISPFVAEAPGGRSSMDGATEVIDEGQGPANAELVTSALRNLWMAGGDREAGLALIAEDCVQHTADAADGRKALAERLRQEPAPLVYEKVHRVCARGNFVAVLSEATYNGFPYAEGDLFRVDNGMIVEHWDSPEAIAPRHEWANSGKF